MSINNGDLVLVTNFRENDTDWKVNPEDFVGLIGTASVYKGLYVNDLIWVVFRKPIRGHHPHFPRGEVYAWKFKEEDLEVIFQQ